MALTAKETSARHAEVVRLRLQAETLTWAQIAARVGLSERACRDAYKAWSDEDKGALTSDESVDVIHRKIAAFANLRQLVFEMIEAITVTACKECGKECGHVSQPATVIGGVRTIADLHGREIDLRQSSGLLPNDLGQIRVQLDIRAVTEAFIVVFDKYLQPGRTIEEGDMEEAELELLRALETGLPSHQQVLADGDR